MTVLDAAARTTDTAEAVSVSGLDCVISRPVLVEALATAGVGIDRRPALPTFGGVLIDGRGDQLTLTGTNIETTVSVRIGATVRCPGRLLVDHAELVKLLSALVKGARKREADTLPVTLSTTADGTAVIELGGYRMPLTGYPAEEFPTVAECAPMVAEVDRAAWTDHARRVLTAAGQDETLPALTGVYLHTTDTGVSIAATDRYRLTVSDLPGDTVSTERTALIPAAVLSAVLRHLDGDRVRLGFTADGGQVSVSCGTLTLTTGTIDGSFPQYERLFPTPTGTVSTERAGLQRATECATAALDATKHTRRAAGERARARQVAVTVMPTQGIAVAPLLAEHTDLVSAPCQGADIDGFTEGVRLLVDARYLQDALGTLGDTVMIHVQTPTRPLLFTSPDIPGFRHLLMPVRPPAQS